jgi:hypothetical protein
MSLARSLVRDAGPISVKHRATAPSQDPHELVIAPALGAPLMGEGMAELVRMQTGDARLLAAPLHNHGEGWSHKAALLTEPEIRQLCHGMPTSHSEVPIEGL